jgi:hypothetical protein
VSFVAPPTIVLPARLNRSTNCPPRQRTHGGGVLLRAHLSVHSESSFGWTHPAQWAVVLANRVFYVAVCNGSRWYHKRNAGIDIGMAFKEVPRE